MLGLKNDSEFFLIIAVMTVIILVLIFGVFKFFARKK
jgi:hypothetical protein